MHRFVAVLDTRPRGSRRGVSHTCTCGKPHLVWACFREVHVSPLPGRDGSVRYATTGKTLVVGVSCAAKVLVPVWETYRVAAALETADRHALHPGDPGYDKLFQEFR